MLGDLWWGVGCAEESGLVRFETKQFKDNWKLKNEKESEIMEHLRKILLEMQDFASSKKKYMFLPIREGIQRAPHGSNLSGAGPKQELLEARQKRGTLRGPT